MVSITASEATAAAEATAAVAAETTAAAAVEATVAFAVEATVAVAAEATAAVVVVAASTLGSLDPLPPLQPFRHGVSHANVNLDSAFPPSADQV